MHRKFIALILSIAMAIAGLSAAPARADGETARLLAGLAALAVIGAAVHKNRKRHTVTRNQTVEPRPLPPRVRRLDLPRRCLRPHTVNGQQRKMLGAGCLNRHYTFNDSLPRICRLGYWDGNKNRKAYAPQCLRERGYRIARH